MYTLTSSVDINMVGRSWVQTNFDNFMASKAPHGDLKDFRSGHNTTNYKIPAWDNWLQKGSLSNWEPGQALPSFNKLDEVSASFTPNGRTTGLLGRNADRPQDSRFEDLRDNITPGILSLVYQGIDKEIASFVMNSSNFDQITVTGTGAIDAFATDQRPFWDMLRGGVAPLRKYAKSFLGQSLEMWIDENVLDVLMAHFNTNPMGAGAALTAGIYSAGPSIADANSVLSMFKRALRLDAVHVFNAVSDTAVRGATSVPQEIGYGLFFFGVFDRRPWDLSKGNASISAPDGCLQVGYGRRPLVKSGIPELSEQEIFVGRTSYDITSPRGATWGKSFPLAKIFT